MDDEYEVRDCLVLDSEASNESGVDDSLVLGFMLVVRVDDDSGVDDGAKNDDPGIIDDDFVLEFILGVSVDDGLVLGLGVYDISEIDNDLVLNLEVDDGAADNDSRTLDDRLLLDFILDRGVDDESEALDDDLVLDSILGLDDCTTYDDSGVLNDDLTLDFMLEVVVDDDDSGLNDGFILDLGVDDGAEYDE